MKHDEFEIPTPCEQDWDEMEEAEGGRFCAKCQHLVVDASAMTQKAFAQLVKQEGLENICANFELDDNDNVIHLPPEPSQLQRQLQGAQKLLSVAATVSLVGLAACDDLDRSPVEKPQAVQPVQAETKPGASRTPPNIKPIKIMPKPTRSKHALMYTKRVNSGHAPHVSFKSALQGVRSRRVTFKDAMRDLELIQYARQKKRIRGRMKRRHGKPALVIIPDDDKK